MHSTANFILIVLHHKREQSIYPPFTFKTFKNNYKNGKLTKKIAKRKIDEYEKFEISRTFN